MATQGVVSISRNELERMRKLAQMESVNGMEKEAKTRLLRELSLEKKQNWPNTLEAIRNKKVIE